MTTQSGSTTTAYKQAAAPSTERESAPAPRQPSPEEVQLLAELYALLLSNIRQNRARRLAQNAPDFSGSAN